MPRAHFDALMKFIISDTEQRSTRLFIMKFPTINIARGTTDPEIDRAVTWIKFSNNMAPLALVAYFTTRWRHLH